MKKRIISLLTALSIPFAAVTMPKTTTAADDVPRQMEYLDRGTVAVKTDGGVYLSWRLLGTENYDTAFDVYRDGELINTVSDTTNMTDADGSADSSYTVVPSGTDVSDTEGASVWENDYLEIPLELPAGGTSEDGTEYTYSPNDACAADVDGDGQYEIILKWEPSNSFDSGKDACHSENVYVDAYELDGTRMWRIDLGKNINAGQHFTQIAAYDLDLDGCAEVAMKTAPGTKDGSGQYVSEASLIADILATDNDADYRDTTAPNGEETNGRVLDGPEFYTVFAGATGDALDTIYYPHPRGTVTEWGDDWGNRSERYLTAVAYLDGVRPSVIAWRGYYAKTTATAFNLENKRLVQVADFSTDTSGNEQYEGQGNHNLTVGDVDGDGCDEILCGALCLDNDLSVKWYSGRGHGDALHLADYDPTHEGMEYFSVHESSPYGMTVYDAKTGTELFHNDGDGDTSRGMMANFSGNGYYDVWGAGEYFTIGGGMFYSSETQPDSTNFRIFWTDSVYDELLDGTGSEGRSFKINDKNGRVKTFDGTATNNSTKCTPCLQADLLGDWREEILVRSADNMSLRLYTTTIQTTHKLYTLMHDSAYRMQTVCQNAGYNQPPHIGYYINEDNDKYDCRKYSSYVSTVHNGKTEVRTENLPSEKPDEIPPSPTPIPTTNPETYYTIDENGVIQKYSGSETNVNIPDTINGITVTAIGEKVFYGNNTITSVTMPDTITEIGNSAFCSSSIGNIKLSAGLTSIGAGAFASCDNLTSIEIPDGVTAIPESAFLTSSNLRRITLPEGLQSIGSQAFYGTALTAITLPDTLKEIGSAAFRNTSLKTIIIPDSVESIAKGAFMDCTDLESVDMGEAVRTIESRAFYGCSALKEITLPSGLTELGESAFYKCTSLESLIIPDGVTKIPTSLAGNCTALETLELPDTLTEIGKSAFYNCSSLASVTILPQVTVIGSSAFKKNASGFTIFGYTNSAAQTFADANNINFTSIGEFNPTPTPAPTLPPVPTCAPDDTISVTTKEATEITETTAVLNGELSGSDVVSAEYVYTLKSGGTIMYISCHVPDWSATISDLSPGETYIYYLYDLTNDRRGDILEFTTLGTTPTPTTVPTTTPTTEPTATPTPLPIETDTPDPTDSPRCAVTTKAATDIEQNTAVLNGELEIFNSIVTDALWYHFWKDGSDEVKTVYGSKTTTPPYQGTIYSLEPGTKYYYYAYNGEVKGETMSFTTLEATPTQSPITTPTIEPTTTPTIEPTTMPTAEPTAEPTATPTPLPTPTDTPPDEYKYPYRIVSDSVSGDTLNVTIERYKAASDAVIICASYDESGALRGVEMKTISGSGSETLSVEFTAAENQKLFIWDSITSMKPMSETYKIKL